MSIQSVLPPSRGFQPGRLPTHTRKNFPAPHPFRFSAFTEESDAGNRQAELFYLQKQIQSKTPMVIVLEDGERVDGCIEWYDRISAQGARADQDPGLQIRNQVHVQAGRQRVNREQRSVLSTIVPYFALNPIPPRHRCLA